MPVELWKSIFDWATIVLIALTVFSGAGALITGDILSKRQEARLRQVDKDLTGAKTELATQEERAADADARVAGLEKDVADAKAEMAKQQTRAATAEGALLKLKDSLKDRTLSPQQEKVLIKALTGAPSGPVEVWWTASDTDSFGLAQKMVGIFKKSGWSEATEHFAAGGTGNGLFIAVHDHTHAPASAVSIQSAYKLIGIDMNGFSKPDVPEGKVQIYIGHKMPAP